MKKRIFLTTFAFISAINLLAQDMRTIVKEMPDSILPLLTRNDRLDFIDYLDSNMKAEVNNRLGGKSEMTAITGDYTNIRTTATSDISLKLLPHNGDSIICMVRTYSAEGSDSKVTFHTKEWKTLNSSDFISTPVTKDFLVFPDSLTQEERLRLTSKLEVPLIKATLAAETSDITFTLTSPLYLNKDDRKAIEPYIRKSIVKKWNNRY